VTKGTKSSKGNKNKEKRTVPIPAFLIKEFKQHRLRTKGDYVFCTSIGTTLSADNIRKYHHKICEKAKVKSISFHALRHTYATRLLENGENFKTIQELLGHADIKTTLNIYTHVLEDTKKSAADKLEALYKNISL
jgi:integrase